MIGLLAFAPAALAGGHAKLAPAPPLITDTLAPGGHAKLAPAPPLITDTLAPGGHAKLAPAPPLITDTLAPGGGAQFQSIASSSSSGFNWADATIGAAGAVGLLLLVFGGVLVRLRTRGAVTA